MKTLKESFWDFVGKHDMRHADNKEMSQLQRVYAMYSKEVLDQIKELEKQINELKAESTKVRQAYYKTIYFMKRNSDK